MRIMVTRDDIAKGLPCNHRRCPIARAIKRACAARAVGVSNYSATVRHVSYWLPKAATAFIRSFDNCRPVSPFSFTMKKV